MDFANWTSLVFAGSVAFSTWMVWRATQQTASATEQLATLQAQMTALNQQLVKITEGSAWLTGAMESHSELMMRLEAKRQNIPVVWWDPEMEPVPVPPGKRHGEPAELNLIYQFLPREMRRNFGRDGAT